MRQRGRALATAAACLAYPDEHWRAGLPALHDRVADLGPDAQHLVRFLRAAEDRLDLAAHYDEVLGRGGPGSAYLTDHEPAGGRSLRHLAFLRAYREVGEELTSGEEPDHLAVVCEFAARHPERGLALLEQHHAHVRRLHGALHEVRSPYVHVLDLVRAAVPVGSVDG